MFIDMHLSVHMCVFVYLAMCVKGEFFFLEYFDIEDRAQW